MTDKTLRSLARSSVVGPDEAIDYLARLQRHAEIRTLPRSRANALWSALDADIFDEEARNLLTYTDPEAGKMLWIPPARAVPLGDKNQTFSVDGFWLAETPLLRRGEIVTDINWHEATAWCAERGLRLPHEVEWEYAARGSDGRTYPWGESPPPIRRQRGWMPASHASPFGCLGMSGSVWQWCQNRWAERLGADRSDPTLPARPCASAEAAAGATLRPSAVRPSATGTSLDTGRAAGDSAQQGENRPDPTQGPRVSCAAAGGETLRPTAAWPSAAGSGLATGMTSWASAQQGERSDPTHPARPGASTAATAGSTLRLSAARPSATGAGLATGAASWASEQQGERPDPTLGPSASCAAAAGSTLRPSADRPSAAGASLASGTDTWASGLPGEEGAPRRVLRGGSWLNSAPYCRLVLCNTDEPGYRTSRRGFRPTR